MKNLIKRIARRILRQELLDKDEERKCLIEENVKLLKELQEYLSIKEELEEKLEESRKIRYTIPEFIICGILNVLPNPNIYAKGISEVIKSNYQGKIYRYEHNYKDGSVKIATFEFLNLGYDGIELKLCDLDCVIFIPLIKVNKTITYKKISTEVTTFAWNINNLGISVIDGESYEAISSFIFAQKDVLGYFE